MKKINVLNLNFIARNKVAMSYVKTRYNYNMTP